MKRSDLEYNVTARRLDIHGSVAPCKDAEITLDTDVKGRPDAFNPAELFLAAIAACIIKGIERAIPILNFDLRGVEVGDSFLDEVAHEMERRFGIAHSTLQVERGDGPDCRLAPSTTP